MSSSSFSVIHSILLSESENFSFFDIEDSSGYIQEILKKRLVPKQSKYKMALTMKLKADSKEWDLNEEEMGEKELDPVSL
jgi:hypothetical protein